MIWKNKFYVFYYMNLGKNKELLLVVGALLVLGVFLYKSGQDKTTNRMSSTGSRVVSPTPISLGEDNYAQANGVKTNTYGARASKLDDPSALLPNDTNSQWASVNPQGGGMLQSVNLLQAGSMIGINTVGSTMRNANLQLRSEPPNPQGSVGPWNNSTIEYDVTRQPLEIGGAP
jgi:hypothetical protein|uniref:Minor capsid protein P11 C-terminal conserved region domain-containing protein n=1 Tax=viral metagenome TaxID=1070528 RepID=A0A6C0HWY3_9ZZZZ